MKLVKQIVLAVAVPVFLAGCAVSGERAEDFYVAPGKYIFYDCTQLAGAAAHFVQRDKELLNLMARAKQGAGGELVSAMAYNSDYYSNLGELKDVRREQAEKKCTGNESAIPVEPARPKAPRSNKKRR
jgi:hypothetical protein